MSDSIPSSADLVQEEGQLRASRRGFLLLAAGLLLQIGLSFLFASKSAVDDPKGGEWLLIEQIELSAASLFFTLLPGALALRWPARSPRWRTASARLLVIVFLDLVLLTTAVFVVPADRMSYSPERHWPTELLLTGSAFLLWPELWFMAVIVAEFSLASRATRLVEESERLGWFILAGAATHLAQVGWSLPKPPFDGNPANLDFVSAGLDIAQFLLMLGCVAWAIRELAQAATLARLLADRCRRVRDDRNAGLGLSA